ncbi:hypothetical protein OAF80_00305 [bacterium]|nr:hypothetical protein [bacterium]
MRIIFTISFIVLQVLSCLAQNNQISDDLKKSYLDAGWFYSNIDSCYVEYEHFDYSNSPDKRHQVIQRSVGLSENVKKTQYLLVSNVQKDTSILTTVLRHDLPIPNVLWTSNQTLIYETGGYGQTSYLKVLDLSSSKIVFSTEGTLPVGGKFTSHFHDSKNNIFIYYKAGTRATSYLATLMRLEYEKYETTPLLKFKGPFEWDYPIIQLDTANRTLQVSYTSDWEDHKSYNEELKY